MKRAARTVSFLLVIGLSSRLSGNGRVIRLTDESKSLDDRWTAAFQSKNELKRSCWIGYSIDVNMDENNHIHSGNNDSDDPTLEELLSGRTVSREMSVRDAARAAVEDGSSAHREKSGRALGILFQFGKDGQRVQDFTEIHISDFDSPLDLDGRPLVWMGNVSQSESLPFLIGVYETMTDSDQKEDVVAAIAFHCQEEGTVPFLKKIVRSLEEEAIRKHAVFWLSQQDTDVLDFLVNVAHTDRSEDVREHAVFAISQSDGKESEEALIALAKKDKDMEIRKKAVFWLGQKASEKATRLLKDVVEDDPDREVKEHAVFALSQMHTAESSKLLMEIAKTSPDREVRKKAIFWLGQSDDPDAVDFLVDLVRGLE